LYTTIEYHLPPPIPFSVTGRALFFGEINSATLDAKLAISESSPWSLLSEDSSMFGSCQGGVSLYRRQRALHYQPLQWLALIERNTAEGQMSHPHQAAFLLLH
jgi:hypothetical protein